MKLRSALALALLLATSAIARAEPSAAGLWEALDDSGKPEGWFLFTQKNEVYSARLVKGFRKEGDDSPVEVVCTKCTGAKKGAHIMGLTLFYGMKRDGLNYENGSVLDPRDGSVYHAKMWLDEDGKMLHVRGYLGISMFGKTQDWKRLPDDAMKKDEIPKEILANASSSEGKGDTAAPDKPKKAKGDSASADKGKSKKAKAEKPKTDEPDAAPTDSSDAEKPAAQ